MLDKTGTITVGRPELVRIETATGGCVSENELFRLTAAVERHSLHPIAKALVEAAQARSLPLLEVHDVKETPGQGISASVGRRLVAVHGAAAPYGEMRVACDIDDQPAGIFVLEDRLKPDARQIFERLLNSGVELPSPPAIAAPLPSTPSRSLGSRSKSMRSARRLSSWS